MTGLRGRLDRLELRHRSDPDVADPGAAVRRREMALIFRDTDNHRRGLRGEDPEPFTAEEEAFEREQDRLFLDDGLRTYGDDHGWQDEASRAVLDGWEREISEVTRGCPHELRSRNPHGCTLIERRDMEPEMLKPGEKIQAPAHIAADRARAAEREGTLGELRTYLEGEHRKALEENPYGHMKFKTPPGIRENLTSAEKAQIEAFEQRTYERLRPVVREKAERRDAFVRAGGDLDVFEYDWANGGEQAHAAETAEANLRRARASSVYD